MMEDLAAAVPASLTALCSAISVGAGGIATTKGADVCSPACLDATLCKFGDAHPRGDGRALVSFWSMYYFAALIVPATAALVCLDRRLPVAIRDIGLDIGMTGCVEHIWLQHDGSPCAGSATCRLETLVRDHLDPLVTACAGWGRLSPRVLWNNAGVMFDYALGELRRGGTATVALSEVEAAVAADPRLATPFRTTSAAPQLERRVCCLRYRLPGVEACPGICPRRPGAGEADGSRSGLC